MNTIEESQIVWNCFKLAVDRFNKSADPKTLLCPGYPPKKHWAAASERAIAHRLAFYLECEIRRAKIIDDLSELSVDCEYNRHVGGTKDLDVEEELTRIVEAARRKVRPGEEDGFYVFSVAPDIVVHQRNGDERNRLVIEIKKRSNNEPPNYDLLKLKLFTDPADGKGYGYSFGAWVIAEDECAPEDRCINIGMKLVNPELKDDLTF